MKVLQQFPGSLLHNVFLDKVSYECGLLGRQFDTSLESKFHIPTPKCESKLSGNRTESVMNFQEMQKKVLISILDFTKFLTS